MSPYRPEPIPRTQTTGPVNCDDCIHGRTGPLDCVLVPKDAGHRNILVVTRRWNAESEAGCTDFQPRVKVPPAIARRIDSAKTDLCWHGHGSWRSFPAELRLRFWEAVAAMFGKRGGS